jgi:hypothetical protein
MGYGGGSTGSFWSAFGTGGFDNEPPLLEELGVNFAHIMGKSLAVLNPLRPVDRNIMDDTDLAGPLLFWLLLGVFLMFSGKVHFGYIYGVAVLGVSAICAILNLMSETEIDVYRTASVLGYCLLPMVILSGTSIIFSLSGLFGLLLTALSVAWCTFVSSGFFCLRTCYGRPASSRWLPSSALLRLLCAHDRLLRHNVRVHALMEKLFVRTQKSERDEIRIDHCVI